MTMPCEVALIFSPLWYYLHIPSELPTVTGYLRTRELQVHAMDLNVDSADYFLSAPYLQRVVDQLYQEYTQCLQAKDSTLVAQSRLVALAQELAVAPLLINAVEDAKSVFRDPERFYDLGQHKQAANILNKCWHLISVAYAPTTLNFQTFKTPFNEESLSDCLLASHDRTHNPYINYICERVLPDLMAAQPRCIALIYIHPEQMIPLMTLIVMLRSAGYTGHITFLGSLEDQVSFTRYVTAPYHPDYEQLFHWIDSVIVYEAEQALAELVLALRREDTLNDIPNLILRRDGHLAFPKRVEIMDLNRLPTPDYSDLPLGKYFFPEPVFAVLSSRGCYWDRCTFCAITTNQLRYRTRSIELVLEDLTRMQVTYGVRWFHFRDMLMSPAYLRRFSLALIHRGLRIRWICRARFEAAFNRDLLALMVAAGCVQVWFGFESANQRILNLMEKGTDASVVSRILQDCYAVGLGVHMLTIHGFPSETSIEVEETVAFLEARAEQIDSCSFTNFILFSGTPIFENAAKFGVQIEDSPRQLLQYRFEHRTSEDKVRNTQRYQQYSQRLTHVLPMPLLHVSHVSLYRERLGIGAWKKADRITHTHERGVFIGKSTSFRWLHPTRWLNLHIKQRQSDLEISDSADRKGVTVLAQAEHASLLLLDAGMIHILDRIEQLPYQQLVEELAHYARLDRHAADVMMSANIKSMLEANFLGEANPEK